MVRKMAEVASVRSEIKRVGLVAHDYNVPGNLDLYDYSEHFAKINQLCDEQGCDTILYALFTWNSTSPIPKTHSSVFGGLTHVQRIALEVWKPPERCDYVEVWLRDQKEPLLAHQPFATSSAATGDKQLFVDDLPKRQVANGLLMICGETNIASLIRGSDEFYVSSSSRLGIEPEIVRQVLSQFIDVLALVNIWQMRQSVVGQIFGVDPQCWFGKPHRRCPQVSLGLLLANLVEQQSLSAQHRRSQAALDPSL